MFRYVWFNADGIARFISVSVRSHVGITTDTSGSGAVKASP